LVRLRRTDRIDRSWLSLDLAICSFDPNLGRIRICIAERDLGRIATRRTAHQSRSETLNEDIKWARPSL
jgi:hypothetical protein